MSVLDRVFKRYAETAAPRLLPTDFVWFKFNGDRGVAVKFGEDREILRKGDRFGAREFDKGPHKDKMRIAFERMGLQKVTYVSLENGDKLLDRSRKIKTPVKLNVETPDEPKIVPPVKPTLPVEKPRVRPPAPKPLPKPAPAPKPAPLPKKPIVNLPDIDEDDEDDTDEKIVVNFDDFDDIAPEREPEPGDEVPEEPENKWEWPEKPDITPPIVKPTVPTSAKMTYGLFEITGRGRKTNIRNFLSRSDAMDYVNLTYKEHGGEDDGDNYDFITKNGGQYAIEPLNNIRPEVEPAPEPRKVGVPQRVHPKTGLTNEQAWKIFKETFTETDYSAGNLNILFGTNWQGGVDWTELNASATHPGHVRRSVAIYKKACVKLMEVYYGPDLYSTNYVEDNEDTPDKVAGDGDNENVGMDFAKTGMGKSAKLLYMEKLWHFYNKTKFDGKMTIPNLELQKDQAAHRMRRRGVWYGGTKRVLAMAPRTFNNKKLFHEIFLHEMCHQAVSEITKLPYREPEQGHGPVWKQWMVKVGLNPSRYDTNSNDMYMTEKEKAEKDKKVEARDAANKDSISFPLHKLRPYTVVRYFDGTNWIPCIAIGLADTQGKRFAVATIDSIRKRDFSIMKVPPSWFKLLAEKDLPLFYEKQGLDEYKETYDRHPDSYLISFVEGAKALLKPEIKAYADELMARFQANKEYKREVRAQNKRNKMQIGY